MKKLTILLLVACALMITGCTKETPDEPDMVPATSDNVTTGDDTTKQELADAQAKIDTLENRLDERDAEVDSLNKKVDDLSTKIDEQNKKTEETTKTTTKPSSTTTSKQTSKSYYRVIAGSYAKKVNADKMVTSLKNKDFDAYAVAHDNGYRVVAGTYGQKKNATLKVDMLKKAGYDSFIIYE